MLHCNGLRNTYELRHFAILGLSQPNQELHLVIVSLAQITKLLCAQESSYPRYLDFHATLKIPVHRVIDSQVKICPALRANLHRSVAGLAAFAGPFAPEYRSNTLEIRLLSNQQMDSSTTTFLGSVGRLTAFYSTCGAVSCTHDR